MKARFIRKKLLQREGGAYGRIHICKPNLVHKDDGYYYQGYNHSTYRKSAYEEVPMVSIRIPDEDFKRAAKSLQSAFCIKRPATKAKCKLVDKCNALLTLGTVIVNLTSLNKHVYMLLESASKRLCIVDKIVTRNNNGSPVSIKTIKEPMAVFTMHTVLATDIIHEQHIDPIAL